MKIVTSHVYHCDPEDYWAHHLDEDSRRAKEVEGCDAVSFAVLSKKQRGGVVTVHSELVEAPQLPAVLRRALGASIRAEEVLRWKKGADTATFEHTPDILSDRIRMTGELIVEPMGDGQCRVTMDATVDVRAFGIAGALEKLVARELPLRQDKAMAWFNANLGSK